MNETSVHVRLGDIGIPEYHFQTNWTNDPTTTARGTALVRVIVVALKHLA